MWIVKDKAKGEVAQAVATEKSTKASVATRPALKKRKRGPKDVGKSSFKREKRPVQEVETEQQQLENVTVSSIPWRKVKKNVKNLKGDDLAAGGFIGLEEAEGIDVAVEDMGTGGGKVFKFKRVIDATPELLDDDNSEEDDSEIEDLLNNAEWISIDDFRERDVQKEKPRVKEIGRANNTEQTEHTRQDTDEVEEPKNFVKESDEMDIASEDELDDAAVSCEAKVEKGLQSADMSAWAEVPLDRKILASLANLGFTRPTEIQARTLPFAIEHKRDIIGAAETGSGKTLAFGLPMLQHIVESGDTNRRKLTGLILTPTRELAIQVVDMLKKVAQWAKVVAVVGGMSVEKQKRQVARHPHIIVATPGRLWELMSDDEPFLSLLKTTHFLAIDEADRMLSAGHFRELDQILSSISISDSRQLKRRTYIFSATLSSTPTLHAQFNKKSHPKRVQEGSMESLLNRLEFLDPKPLYVNVLREGLTARGLEERRIECLHTEKETYLYYILKSFPARTLLFANSIDTIRRLIPLLTLLNIPAFPLHAEMQQRQRLKNLDRFKSAANAVLVASDVAARGLDIPAVEQVVHFQLPRSADLYVHRSGRTARSTETGLSIMLISPAEVPIYKKICNILNKSDGGIPELPVPLNLIGGYKKRVTLAQKIDTLQHRTQKQSFEDAWMKKAAEEMDIIFDEDFVNAPSKQAAKKEKSDDSRETTAEVRKLKAQLADLLQQEVSARGGQSILGMKGDEPDDLPSTLKKHKKGRKGRK